MESLDLIYNYVCGLKFIQMMNRNMYSITFVDEIMKYCYVYLMKNKDEDIDKFTLYKHKVENQLNKNM